MGEDIPVPAVRKKRGNEESRIQQALIRWWVEASARYRIPETLLFAIPNGGWRDAVGATILKREGQRNGVSDLFLAVPRRWQHGLFIELKTATGKPTMEQVKFIEAASAAGYRALVCYSYENAVAAIEEYLT